MQGCDLREASFLRCDLTMVDCSRSQFLGLELRHCDLPGLDLCRIGLQGFIINEDQQQTLLEQVGLIVLP